MADLPKSVLAAMKAQAAPQEHPDADLLAAFSEQALSARERENVLAHLAVCAACRETVALAAPVAPAQEPAIVLAPWYRRPRIFAWASTFATVALMAALVVNYGHNRHSSKMATDAMNAKLIAPPVSENQPSAPAAQNEVASAAKKDEGAAGTLRAPSRDKAAAKGGPIAVGGAGAAGTPEQRAQLVVPKQEISQKDQKKLEGGSLASQYSAMKEMPAPAAPPPPPSRAAAAATANMATAPSAAADMVETKPKTAATAESVMVQSAPATRVQNAEVAGALAGGTVHSATAKKATPVPVIRWSISDKGKLQRSLDAGSTWQPVLDEQTTVIRTLAVVGNEVWAAGSGATVYHSADGGANWSKQTLPGASADVTSLQFADAQHGSAHTADGGAWSTSDGGQHWAKQ